MKINSVHIEYILDVLEQIVRKSALTHTTTYGESDSGLSIPHAEAFRLLAADQRFRVTRDYGGRVYGYWPENDPEQQ